MILFPKRYSVRRVSGAYVKGVWQNSTTATLTITADIQTATDKDIKTLPVDRQNSGTIKIYSKEALRCAKQGTDEQGDLVEWDNRLWEVISVETHQNGLLPHYKSMAQYIGEI